MKFFYAKPSPYARKVRVVIAEKVLQDRIEEVLVDPFSDPEALHDANPLGKVPCLSLDDGRALYDSPVICEFLDQLSAKQLLIPAEGPQRWDILRQQALSDGMLDAAFNIVMELHRRPENQRSEDWIRRWLAALRRGLHVLETDTPPTSEKLTLADISAACTLGYLDFRLDALLDWRQGCPIRAAWFEDFSQRPSMIGSLPTD